MISFPDLWQLLYRHGATNIYRDECMQLWDSLTTQQKKQLFSSISQKLQKQKFVHYNPLIAMQNNIRTIARAEPVNLNGTARGGRMLEEGTAFIACYNGQYGLYSLQDIDDFHMQIKMD